MSAETYAWMLIIGIVCGVLSIAALIADWITNRPQQWFTPSRRKLSDFIPRAERRPMATYHDEHEDNHS